MCKLFAREAREDGDNEVARCLNELRRDESLQRMQLGKALSSMEAERRTTARAKGQPHD